LRTVISAGEACSADIVARWAPGRRFINAYGPAEATVCATLGECRNGSGRPSIGRPIANTQVYILDRHRQPVPIGVPGELYIGGDGLARGYLNRPELTAERFIPHPFRSEPGARLYKTGDLARYLPDGTIEYLGRLDHQVKLRGFRIELEEIETVLGQHPAVHEAVVIVREDTAGDKRLVAYVVPRPGYSLTLGVGRNGRPSAEELRGYLEDRLPEYMVPAAFAFLDTLPRTPNQKVDRLALPAPTRSASNGHHVAPRDELERRLATIWERELNIAPISMTDNFFHLGGHSLLAVRLFSEIEKALGTRLPVATLFTAQTVEQLAALLRQEGWAPEGDKAAPSRERPGSLLTVRATARGAARTMLHALRKRRL
jgi:acyl carrier protein